MLDSGPPDSGEISLAAVARTVSRRSGAFVLQLEDFGDSILNELLNLIRWENMSSLTTLLLFGCDVGANPRTH